MIDLVAPENWDTPLFPVAVAASAALIEPATLRMWIQRGGVNLWTHPGNQPAAGDGLPRLLSLRTVLHISAAARLVSKGVKVADAYSATMHWTHIGDTGSYWEGDEMPPADREPGGLFRDPNWTFLIHHRGEDARVVKVAPTGDELPFKFADLFAKGGPLTTPPTIVFLNKVDRYVRGICSGYLR